MTRSIFDPTGPNTERSGSAFMGPDANQISHMPSDVIDGVVEPDEDVSATPDAAFDSSTDQAAAGDAAPPAEGDKTDPDGALLRPEDSLSHPDRDPQGSGG